MSEVNSKIDYRLTISHYADKPGFVITLDSLSHGIVEIHNRDADDPSIYIVEAGDTIRCDLNVHVEKGP